jgi:hypothetical protein
MMMVMLVVVVVVVASIMAIGLLKRRKCFRIDLNDCRWDVWRFF